MTDTKNLVKVLAPDGSYWLYTPQPDITAYEVAQCLEIIAQAIVTRRGPSVINVEPVRRHFTEAPKKP